MDVSLHVYWWRGGKKDMAWKDLPNWSHPRWGFSNKHWIDFLYQGIRSTCFMFCNYFLASLKGLTCNHSQHMLIGEETWGCASVKHHSRVLARCQAWEDAWWSTEQSTLCGHLASGAWGDKTISRVLICTEKLKKCHFLLTLLQINNLL